MEPNFFDRINHLVMNRDLNTGVAQALVDAGATDLLDKLEQATDEQLANLDDAWRALHAANQALRARAQLDDIFVNRIPPVVAEPRRIQRKRTAGWRMPEGAVFVGRPTEWGNPWQVGKRLMLEWPVGESKGYGREVVITPELAVALYRIAFTPDAEQARAELGGRDLACWCPLDQPCHADVLLELANPGSRP